jgi:salicylate hydroxylase
MHWMGPGGHIIAYPLKPTKTSNGKVQNMLYNMGFLRPTKHSDVDTESWTNKGSKKEMLDFYSSWDPIIQDLLKYVPEDEVMEWTLNMHKPLPPGSRAR